MAKSIEETKDMLALCDKALSIALEAKGDDGVIDLSDLPKLAGLIPYIGPAIIGADEIQEELADLDTEEAKELLDQMWPMVKKILELINV